MVEPSCAGAVVVEADCAEEPSWFVVVEVVVEEPSRFSVVEDEVWLYEPSSFVVVEDVWVVVEPSWFSIMVSVNVITDPSSSTKVYEDLFATYSTDMFFVVV